MRAFPKKANGNRINVCRKCKKTRRKENKAQQAKEQNKLEKIVGKKGKVTVTHIGGEWETVVDVEEARLLFALGCAKVIDSNHVLFYKFSLVRKYILERDQYTCAYCGEYGDTMDHLHPQSKGGTHVPSNLVTACETCNRLKGDMGVKKFLKKQTIQPKRMMTHV